ncbi:MAG: hypothetical protein AAFY60_07630, partial [Myxococcota bacterium]
MAHANISPPLDRYEFYSVFISEVRVGSANISPPLDRYGFYGVFISEVRGAVQRLAHANIASDVATSPGVCRPGPVS